MKKKNKKKKLIKLRNLKQKMKETNKKKFKKLKNKKQKFK